MKRWLTGTPRHAHARATDGTPARHLVAELARLGGRGDAARALLTALAWGRGPGLPVQGIWVPVANALSLPGTAPLGPAASEADVRWLLRKAGHWVAAGRGPGGCTVHRLRDDRLAAWLRRETPARRSAEAAVTRALLATVPRRPGGRDWAAAHPYVRACLAQHAAAAGQQVLAELLTDPGFVAAADPASLGPLMFFPGSALRDLGRCYQWALPMLGEDPRENAACLAEAAHALGLRCPVDYPGASPGYLPRFTNARREDSLRALPLCPLTGVALGSAPDGRTLLATACDDHLVRLYDAVTGEPAGELEGHTDGVIGVAFGTVPAGTSGTVPAGTSGTVPAGTSGTVPGCGGGDGRLLLASASDDRTVRVWDPLAGQQLGGPLSGHTDRVWQVAFGASPQGRLLLASASADQTVRVWDPLAGQQLGGPLSGHTGQVYSVAFGTAPDGTFLLASASHDATVRLWDPLAGTVLAVLNGHGDKVSGVSFGTVTGDSLPGGGRLLLASSSWDETVRLWDPLTAAPVGEPMNAHAMHVQDVAFGTTRDGRLLLASGHDDHMLRLWDPLTCAPASGVLSGHKGMILSLSFGTTREGRPLLVSSAWEPTVRVWDPLLVTADLPSAEERAGAVTALACLTVGERTLVAAAAADYAVRVFDGDSGAAAGAPLAGHQDRVSAVALAATTDGRVVLASGGRDRAVRVAEPLTGIVMGKPLTHDEPVTAAAFGTAPDGRLLLASGTEDGTIRLWDPLTSDPLGGPLAGHRGWVGALAFGTTHGHGQGGARLLLASAGADGAVRLWDPLTGQPVRQLATGRAGVPSPVHALAFGTVTGEPGRGRLLLAAGGADGRVTVWDPLSAAITGGPFTGHDGWVASLAFTADRRGHPLLASGSGTAVRLWDLAAAVCVTTLRRRSPVSAVAASGPLLAIGDDEGVSAVELLDPGRRGAAPGPRP